MHFTAIVTQEGEWYAARCLEVEVASQGHTVEESLANLREALELYFEDAPPVQAAHPIVAPVEVRQKLRREDGRVVIVPLHADLAHGTLGSIPRQAG